MTYAPVNGLQLYYEIRGSGRPLVLLHGGLLTDKPIRRGVHTCVQALENDIRDWIASWNDNPRPFTWTKTADEILNSLADYLAKLGPGHPVNKAELTNRTSDAEY